MKFLVFTNLKNLLFSYAKFILVLSFCGQFSNAIAFSDVQQYGDVIYDPSIKTVRMHSPDFQLSAPVIHLHTESTLLLSFDKIGSDLLNFYYTIELCNADWEAAPLVQAEYIGGFFEDMIEEYSFSFATRVSYIHYSLTFPNANMRPLKAGNYVMKVYTKQNNEQLIAFVKKFYVLDSQIDIDMNVKEASNLNDKWTSHEIDFRISSNFRIENPARNVKVILQQNGRIDNIITLREPKFIRGNVLDYDFDEENVFKAGNEFRSIDLKSMNYQTVEIDGIQRIDGVFHVFLTPDISRRFARYSSKTDINGRYYIQNDDGRDSRIDADYVYVYFTLLSDAPRTDGNIYVNGELLNWGFSEEAKMKYNYERKAYETILLLKQGYYEYQYLFVPNDLQNGDVSIIEGSHFATENEYTVRVYYRKPGELFDTLIGLQYGNSRN